MNKKYIYIGGLLILFYLLSRKKENGQPQIQYIVDALPKHPTKVYSKRTPQQVQQIVLHHYASNGTPQAIANYHVNTRDWAGIGYHFTINRDGTISQVNQLDTISYHVSGQNTKSVGVALEGDFSQTQPTPAQMAALEKLIPYIRSLYPQPLQVYQHSDFASHKPHDANLDLTPYKLPSVAAITKEIPSVDMDDYQECNDGTYTTNFNGGACSHHGGINNPIENIAQSDLETFFYKDYTIIEFLEGNKISINSYLEYGNRDYIKHRLNFLSKNGKPLDLVAQELESQYNQPYDIQEIVDIIEEYPSPSAAMYALKEKTFEHLRQMGMGDVSSDNIDEVGNDFTTF